MSRTQQKIHNPTDVLAGALIGTVIAIFFFYQSFINFGEFDREEGVVPVEEVLLEPEIQMTDLERAR
jgi:membrane-associated phospholipid phosphatase